MSASPVAVDHCRSCGVELPPSARFCPACGAPIDAGETAEAVLPPHEPVPAPTTYQRAEPHWFGIAPPHLLLALAGAAFVAGIVLFATGPWPYGLILVGLGALLVAGFLETARRRPVERLARSSSAAKERARSSFETLRVRQAAAAELRRIQSGLALLEADRRAVFHELGAATHLHDRAGEAAAHAKLVELDRHEAALREALARTHAEAGERIRRARLPVQETMMVLPTEPSPPPGEATPPQPAQVPEPYPPPDEATPPQPARVPEPSPDPGPDRGD
jgi:zinc-ribbon domain